MIVLGVPNVEQNVRRKICLNDVVFRSFTIGKCLRHAFRETDII